MTILRSALLLLILLTLSHTLFAQKQNNIWYFGSKAGIDFNGPVPMLLSDGAIESLPGNPNEGCASIADRHTGALLFYTDGITVWNRTHQPMPNGTSLLGSQSTTQGALILPVVGDSMKYYLLTIDIGYVPFDGVQGLSYSIVDMQSDGGNGDVVVKNVPLFRHVGEKLTAVPHCNGQGYWVLCEGWIEQTWYAFPLTSTGFGPPVISRLGIPGDTARHYGAGYLKASPDGRLLAAANSWSESGRTILMEFDNSTGMISNPVTLPSVEEVFPTAYGVCFSPDNSKVYVTHANRLYQYDVTTWDAETIDDSRYLLHRGYFLGGMELGPDGRIYISRGADHFLSVVDHPDSAGPACGLRLQGFDLGEGTSRAGLQNLIAHSPTVESDLSAGADDSICVGESTRLSASGAFRYRWSPDTTLSCSECADPVANPIETTIYYLSAVTDKGCIVVDSVTIIVHPLPDARAGEDTAICRGGSTVLTASGGWSYLWSPAEGLSCTDCPAPVAAPTVSTMYTILVGSADGCSATDSVRVTVRDLPTIDVGPDARLCAGDGIRLSATVGVSYSWSPAEGLSCTDCRQPFARPLTTTLYRVMVVDSNGCSAGDSVMIAVLPLPQADAGPDTAICAGASIMLNASGGDSYQWVPAAGLSCVDCANPIAEPLVTTVYHVLATSADGCSASDSITVTVITPESVDAGSTQSICAGESVLLTASDGASWRWSPAEGLECTDCRSPRAQPKQTTLYTVTVTGPTGCFGTDTVSVIVSDRPRVAAGSDTSICTGGAAYLQAGGAVEYAWSPSEGLSCTDCVDPVATPARTTTYRVTGVSADGCSATDDVTVSVSNPRLVRLSIDTTHLMVPGSSLVVPVMLEDAIAEAVDSVTFALQYNGTMLLLNDIETVGLLLDGWSRETLTDSIGGIRVRFAAPSTRPLPVAGRLLELNFTTFIGDTTVTHLPFSLSLGSQPCLDIETRSGRIQMDSICGMLTRLIEMSSSKYTLSQNSPNPFNPSTTIGFSLGLDGPTRLEVLNAAGERVALLVDANLQSGGFEVTWNAGELPSGIYYYRLTSGHWSQVNRMAIVR